MKNNKYILSIVAVIAGLLFIFLLYNWNTNPQINIITNFEECVEAGYPIMESYPRQCSVDGKTFTEELEDNITGELIFHECTEEEKQASICTQVYEPVCVITEEGGNCTDDYCLDADVVTFSNSCVACSNQAIGYYERHCEDIGIVKQATS